MTTGRRHVLVVTADQALSSATNLTVALLVARASPASAFGLFALTTLASAAAIGLARTWVAEPCAVLSGHLARTRDGRRIAATMFLRSFLVAMLLACVLSGGMVLGWELRLTGAAGIVLLFLPVLVMHDLCRHIAIAWRRATWALTADAFWFFSVATSGWLILHGVLPPFPLVPVLTWCLAGAVSMLCFLPVFLSVAGNSGPTKAPAVIRAIMRLGWPAGVEYALLTGGLQIAFFLAASVLGPAGVAGPRAALLLFGITTVVFAGISQAMLPLLARDPGAVARPIWRMQGLFVATTIVVAVIFAATPRGIGQWLLGATWTSATQVLAPTIAYSALMAITVPALVRVRVTLGTRQLFRWRAPIGVILPACAYLGAQYGPAGFMWGLVAGQTLDTIIVQWVASHQKPARAHAALPEASGSLASVTVS